MIYSLVGLGAGLVIGYFLGSRNNLDIDLYNAIKAEMKAEKSQSMSKATKEGMNNNKQNLTKFTLTKLLDLNQLLVSPVSSSLL